MTMSGNVNIHFASTFTVFSPQFCLISFEFKTLVLQVIVKRSPFNFLRAVDVFICLCLEMYTHSFYSLVHQWE